MSDENAEKIWEWKRPTIKPRILLREELGVLYGEVDKVGEVYVDSGHIELGDCGEVHERLEVGADGDYDIFYDVLAFEDGEGSYVKLPCYVIPIAASPISR